MLLFSVVGGGVFWQYDQGVKMEPGQVHGPALSLSAEEAYPLGALPEGLFFERLLLEKKQRRLTAYYAGRAVRVYLVALGPNPAGPKEAAGDGRTPEGNYIIDSKNPKSAYYKSLGFSYPDKADKERALARQLNPGGGVGIHGLAPRFAGLGAAHRLTDWTCGCAALSNPEMDEFYARTPVGTPITIAP